MFAPSFGRRNRDSAVSGMAFRVVLSGACGVHSGKVIEWSYESLLCTPPCGHRRSIGSVTGNELIAGLRAAWPKDLQTVDFDSKQLTVLHNGKVVPLSEPLSTSLALAATPAPSTETSPIPSPQGMASQHQRVESSSKVSSPVPAGLLLHLVFRPLPSGRPVDTTSTNTEGRKAGAAGRSTTSSGAPPRQQADGRRTQQRDGGCCVVC